MNKKRAKPGDFFEVRTSKGIGYVRFLGRLPGRIAELDAFAVLDNPGWSKVPDGDLPNLKVRYYTTSSAKYLPRFNSNFILIPGPKDARVHVPRIWRTSRITGWIIVVNGLEEPAREMDAEMAKLPIIEIVPGNIMAERMFSDWTPEAETKDSMTRCFEAIRDSQGNEKRKEFIVFLEFDHEKDARKCMRYVRSEGYDVKLGKDKRSLIVTSYPDRSEDDWITSAEKAVMTIAERHGARYMGNEAAL